MAFVVENSGHGGSIAAPIARQVLARIFLPDTLQTRILAPRIAADTSEVERGD
jgi:hypothetical protein